MSRHLELLLLVASSVVTVGSVVAMSVVRGVQTQFSAYGQLNCDPDGVCVPPDAAMPGIVTGALAPVAFEVGLIGLVAALVLRIAVRRWPPVVSAGAPDVAGSPAAGPAGASWVARPAASTNPHDAYRPPPAQLESPGESPIG